MCVYIHHSRIYQYMQVYIDMLANTSNVDFALMKTCKGHRARIQHVQQHEICFTLTDIPKSQNNSRFKQYRVQ